MKTALGHFARPAVGLVALLAAALGPAAELWTENAQEALDQAAKESKDLLIDFTGSDWCGYCIALDKEVFSQAAFKTEAPKHFVLLKLDFPEKRELPEAIQKQNAQWQKRFAVRGFPTIILADSSGKPYAKTSYQEGGAEAYLKHLGGLLKGREQRDGLLAKAKTAQGVERAKLLAEALTLIPLPFVMADYSETVEEIVKLDPDNQAGLKAKYRPMLILKKVGVALNSREFDQAISLADEALKALGDKGPAAQDAFLLKSLAHLQKGDKAAARQALEAALRADPEGPKAEQIQGILDRAFKDEE